jgi:G6PDH family F420-dependent oxidoreductase
VGSGEALNEQILGDPWPPADVRLEMLEEAVGLIRELWRGESVTWRGDYYMVEDARIYDPPPQPLPIVVSAFGPKAARLAARIGDGLWMSSTSPETVKLFEEEGGSGPVFSQMTLCWAEDREQAIDTAHRIWPNTGVPGQLSQDLRTPQHFEMATSVVTKEMIAESLPAGPDPEPYLEKARAAIEAGVDHLYFHQIGEDQEGFVAFWKEELEGELRV